jgi:hypothetical protein
MKQNTHFFWVLLLMLPAIVAIAQPTNDLCVNAGVLTCGSNVNGTTVSSVPEPSSPGGCASLYGVWYTFTGDGNIATLTSTTGGFDHEIDVFTGSCGTLMNIACQDASVGTETYSFLTTNGTVYYVYIAYFSTTGTSIQTGTFTLSLTCTPLPTNDNCSSAITLTPGAPGAACPGATPGNTTGATQSQTACTGIADDDVWYSFMATASTHFVTIASSVDMVHQTFSGTCGSLTSVICSDPNTSTLTGLMVGTTYYIRVHTWSSGNNATFDICITTPPSNDNCAGAITLTTQTNAASCSSPVSATTSGATTSVSDCSTSQDDVWFTFTANAVTQIVRFESVTATLGSVTSMGMNLYTTCGGAQTNCNPGITLTSGTGAANLTGLTIGTTYFLRVWTGGTSNAANFNICIIDLPPAPSNDLCSNAQALVCNGGSINGTTTGCLPEASSPGGCSSLYGVWYTFTGDGSFVTLASVPTGFNHEIDIFTGSCGTFTTVVCQDGSTGTETYSFSTTNGTVYYVYIAHFSTTATALETGTFTLSLSCIPPPSNDNCAGATALTPQANAASCSSPVSATTAGASTSVGDCSTGQDDVWFTFTAGAATQTVRFESVTATLGSVSSMGMNLYTACGVGTGTNCNTGITLTSGAGQANLTGLTTGTTYFLRVWTAGTSNAASFNICIINPPPVPTNDACAGAIPVTNGSSITLNVASATNETSAPTCSGVSLSTKGVWYVYTQPAGQTSTVTIAGCNTDYDSRVRVYTGTCAALVCVTGDDNDDCSGPGNANAETTTFTASAPLLRGGVSAPVDYYILITGAGDNLSFSVSAAALPLELTSFTAKNNGAVNTLAWETATEKNVQWHIVERSANGSKWTEVGRKAALNDARNAMKYEMEDKTPLARTYYRLRSVDFDGAENISRTVVVTRTSDLFSINTAYPSPTSDRVVVQFNSVHEADVIIRVSDLMGRIVLTQNWAAADGINDAPVSLQSLQAGVYMITVADGNTVTAPVRVVKQ